jgi:hypothetical protein
MTFLELLQALEHRLGYQHLPLNPQATTLKQIFECSPVHHELMHRLVQALYQANDCSTLHDNVDKDTCFAAIGPVRQQTLKTASTDVDAYRLLDELCHALNEIFTGGRPTPTADGPVTKLRAEVIPLDPARRRRNRR